MLHIKILLEKKNCSKYFGVTVTLSAFGTEVTFLGSGNQDEILNLLFKSSFHSGNYHLNF